MKFMLAVSGHVAKKRGIKKLSLEEKGVKDVK